MKRLFALLLFCGSVHAADWLQFGYDPQHSGNNTQEATLTVSNVGNLSQLFSVTLPAKVDSEPVLLQTVTTLSGVRDLLYVTTIQPGGHVTRNPAIPPSADVWAKAMGIGTSPSNWPISTGPGAQNLVYFINKDNNARQCWVGWWTNC